MRLTAIPQFVADHEVNATDTTVNKRYVVSLRMTGLGDRLVCLAAAWRYARHTGRSLVADWRFGWMTPEPSRNAFPLCFRSAPDLAGVPFLGDRHMAAGSLPKPRFPEIWNEDALLETAFMRSDHDLFADRDRAVRLIREGRDVSAPTVVFDACVNDGLVHLDDARTFLSALRPVRPIAEAVAAFRRSHMAGRKVAGLHLRHGNGGDIMAHAPYWGSFDDAIDRCVRAVHHVRHVMGDETAVLLCTDGSQVHDALEAALPDLIVRPKAFRPAGEGELHLGKDAWTGRNDALVEMLLLAQCAALIRYPPGSFFSFYAAALLAEGQPSLGTVYDLHRPWDPADALSPAVIFRWP